MRLGPIEDELEFDAVNRETGLVMAFYCSRLAQANLTEQQVRSTRSLRAHLCIHVDVISIIC